MKYKVLYASVGLLSGHQPGDVVDVADEGDAAHLVALGLIEPHDGKAAPEGDGQTGAEALKADQDRKLEPYKKGGGWYQFGEGEGLMKTQNREAALEELGRRESAAGDTAERE